MNEIVIRASSPDGSAFDVCYRLLSTPIAEKFIRLLSASLSEDGTCRTQNTMVVRQPSAVELDNALHALKLLVVRLSEQSDELQEWTVFPQIVGQRELNSFHSCFERFERRKWSASLGVQEDFAALNRQIHLVEGLIGVPQQTMKTYFSTEPPYIAREPLGAADFDCLDVQLRPGRLYMGYYTVGKNWLSVYRQNDLDLLRDGTVSPQTHANSQMVGIFCDFEHHQVDDRELISNFYRWWDSNDVCQFGFERLDWRSLVLGWFPVAELKDNDDDSMRRYLSISTIDRVQLA